MERIEKTVFISYRRKDIFHALSVFQHLTHHGYDVFFDFDGIGSGDFERIILENIKARAHFLVLLTPSALERCSEPADWLRREIETAIQTKRNIIPLMFDGFDFGKSSIASQLTGKLATLKNYNALPIVAAYFTAAMSRLREQYLNVPLETVLHPASRAAQDTAKAQRAAAIDATLIKQDELIAEEEQPQRELEPGTLNALSQFKKQRAFDRQLTWYETTIRALQEMAQKIDVAITFQDEPGTTPDLLGGVWRDVQNAHLALERIAIEAPLYASDEGLKVIKTILAQVQAVANATEAFDPPKCKPSSLKGALKRIEDLSEKLTRAIKPLAQQVRALLDVK
jgi:TIR domain